MRNDISRALQPISTHREVMGKKILLGCNYMFYIRTLVLCIVVPISAIALGNTASFDCGKAKLVAEKIICTNGKLIEYDKELNQKYNELIRLVSDNRIFKQEQLQWLKKRNSCNNDLCIEVLYMDRLNEINSKIDFTNSISIHISKNWIPSAQRFELIYGNDASVCNAYKNMLNGIIFYRPPYCPREDIGSKYGFEKINTIKLNRDANVKVFNCGQDFIVRKSSKMSTDKASQCGTDKETSDGYGVDLYSPTDIDIDNDGIIDDVIYWEERIWNCGIFDEKNIESYQPRYLFILKKDYDIDYDKTLRYLFADIAIKYKKSSKKVSAVVKMNVINMLSITKYRNRYYFDGFVLNENELIGDVRIKPNYDNYGVYEIVNNKRVLRCKFKWVR
jgi:uncharacterized protein YecT (DUF1311 family)